MIKILKNQADAKRIKDWDERVMVQVRAVLAVLDESYGANRRDLGGFVLSVIETQPRMNWMRW